jgi:KipI family sensor histidine kinase inhibitor
VRWFGDGALVTEVGSGAEAHRLAAALSEATRHPDPRWPGVEEVVVGHQSVLVVADPARADLGTLAHELARIPLGAPVATSTRRVEIPVCFDGPDLDEVAVLASMSRAAVVRLLIGSPLTVAFVGFLPGFAYLEGLPPVLADIPRRASPRTAVPAGSFAIAGGFAGVYPQVSPGGWQLLGRTGFPLFDPDTAPFAALGPGDTVWLRAVDDAISVSVPGRHLLRSEAARTVEVAAPGLLTMVQDGGRIGVARLGVPRAGGADPDSLHAANRLVGNEDDAGALEITAQGPRLRFAGSAHVALVGRANLAVDGRPVALDSVVPLSPGQELSVGSTLGDLRCYLAVSGGFDVAPVLGSRSSDVLTGLGPGPLRTGDVLGVGPATRPRGRLEPAARRPGAPLLRVLPGPDELGPGALDLLATDTWEVAPDSDRMGVRLRGHPSLWSTSPDVASRGMVTGAVQVPPDGRPVVLLCDHATVGGYPVVATVIRADLGVLGQLRPGDPVRFEPVDRAEADRARGQAQRALDRSVVGWFPVRAD